MADTLHQTTLGIAEAPPAAEDLVVPALTIAHHPDLGRVGEQSLLNDPASDEAVRLSRLAPLFCPPRADRGEPLGDPHLSRTPHRLAPEAGGIRLSIDPGGAKLLVDGVPASGTRFFSAADLERGLVLELADRVVLVLHLAQPALIDGAGADTLLGVSGAMVRLRQQIERVAAHDVPVLLRGESGTGKELAARAIHEGSRRRASPFVAVNLAAVTPSTAAAALFGHEKGAFTGATRTSEGFFGKADGGTLFLDELGDTPAEIQPALLRALESGEVQPLGRDAAIVRDVRLIGATDADLEALVADGRFRLPLLQRMAGYELRLPPLRQRREDIGLLLVSFLRHRLDTERLEPAGKGRRPWLPAALVARAARGSWPGNVRELRNFAQRLVVDFGDAPEIPRRALDLLPEQEASSTIEPAPPADTKGAPRLLRDIAEDEVIEALRRHDYKPGPAADELGLARSSIYALIDSSPRIRKAGELAKSEIERALEAAAGDTRAAARALEVSERGLTLRMKQLGMR